MKNYKFYKNDIGWFVELPEWEGEEWELQMVSGADTFLNILSQGKNEVYITLSTEYFNSANILQFIELGRLEGPEMGSGAWYFLNEYHGISYSLEMWLCDVTKFVFGDFPKKIYFR